MIQLILVLALLGVLVYLITSYIPMPPAFKTIIIVVAVICVIIYLIQIFGLDFPLPRARLH